MSEIRLKSCPFCGGGAEIEMDESWYWQYHIFCPNCNIGTSHYEKSKDAIETWNTRKPMERIVDRLEEEKETHKFLIQHASKTGTFIEKRQHEKAVEVYDRAIELVKAGGVDD